jgi:DNA ligase-1
MSEKLDGVRAFWTHQKLISRSGRLIKCPPWFTEGLPRDILLDGELWLGRQGFEVLSRIVNSTDSNISWHKISYMIFDLPDSKQPYHVRMNELLNLSLPKHAHIVGLKECQGNDDLREYLIHILELGGEGLMVNKSDSFYIPQRVDTLLKVKVFIYEC